MDEFDENIASNRENRSIISGSGRGDRERPSLKTFNSEEEDREDYYEINVINSSNKSRLNTVER